MYSTMEMRSENRRASKTWVTVASTCLFGFAAGLVMTSAASSLFAQSTQTVRAAPTYATLPRMQQGMQAARLNAADRMAPAADAISNANVVPVLMQGPNSFFPLVLVGSAAMALGWGLKKLVGAEPVAMMSTTAVKREWICQNGKKYKGVHPIIAPSLLAADLANLAADSKRVLEAGADVLHVDVMDGHFVPNLSWGAPVIKCLRQHTNAFFDTHLMVSNPEDFIAPMKDAGVDQFTFHIEAAKDVPALIKAIKDAGMKVGISVKPKTPIDVVFPYIKDVDLILVMTVEPGFGGQSFMEDMMPKVKTLREKYPNLEIQVDGGLSPKTIDAAAKAGANAIVAGSACFVADPKSAIDAMRESVEKYCTGPGM